MGPVLRASAGLLAVAAASVAAPAEGQTGPRGFDTVLRAAGPENPVYRTRGEVVEDLLGAAAEQLGIVQKLKLGRMLRDGPDTAKPKRAPFWRSGLALASVRDNVDGVLDLLEEGDFGGLLPKTETRLADRIGSELRRAHEVLAGLSGGALPDLLSDPETHRRITGAASRIGAVAASRDGARVAVTSPRGGRLAIWNARTRKVVETRRIADVCGVASGGGGFFASDGNGRIWRDGEVVSRRDDVQWDNHLAFAGPAGRVGPAG